MAEDKDALDVADFELAAIHLLGADVRLYSDRVLRKPHCASPLSDQLAELGGVHPSGSASHDSIGWTAPPGPNPL